MPQNLKHERFKKPIMATVKVLGLYPGVPSYSSGVILMWLCFGLPFCPIYIYATNLANDVPLKLLLFYFPLYVIQTIFLGKFIVKTGNQWSTEEYKNLTSDQVVFPFIFTLGMHGLFQLILFLVFKNILVVLL